MAIDTKDKRSSALSPGIPWRAMFPAPDGSLGNTADRQHVGFWYRGISSQLVAETTSPSEVFTTRPRGSVYSSPARGSVWSATDK